MTPRRTPRLEKEIAEKVDLLGSVERLEESNPMLGMRGVRLEALHAAEQVDLFGDLLLQAGSLLCRCRLEVELQLLEVELKLLGGRQELVQRRVEEADRHRQAAHRLEDA